MSGTRIIEARTDKEWGQGCSLLRRVYVGEGYTDADRAAQFQSRERMGPAGVFLLAVDDAGDVKGAVLFLHEGSGLQQIAIAGEREFRMLAVDPEARGAGVGEMLVQACIALARADDALGLVLWTQPTMPTAQRLYERLGFVRDPDRDVPDPRGWDRMVYVRIF
ncbi:MAG: GNAT family N-acetyltransferase [Flavobacteriales bacterium]